MSFATVSSTECLLRVSTIPPYLGLEAKALHRLLHHLKTSPASMSLHAPDRLDLHDVERPAPRLEDQ
jgi:hypothetical protein